MEKPPLFTTRRSGVLLHPTSLPGDYGIGTFGKEAYRWIDKLAQSGQRLWQILPLGPTGYGNSPYQSYSAFAGNPLLIDLNLLQEDGWLIENISGKRSDFNETSVDYEWVSAYKLPLLKNAFLHFRQNADNMEKEIFEKFCEEESVWLEDFALFMALKKENQGKIWYEWEERIVRRESETLTKKRDQLKEEIDFQKFLHLPHNGVANSVIYTGTHDNDTTLGWFENASNKSYILEYLSRDDDEIHWAMIREAMASVSVFSVVPMQDILGLGSFARMNRPGDPNGNWSWRMTMEQMERAPFEKMERLTRLYGRC